MLYYYGTILDSNRHPFALSSFLCLLTYPFACDPETSPIKGSMDEPDAKRQRKAPFGEANSEAAWAILLSQVSLHPDVLLCGGASGVSYDSIKGTLVFSPSSSRLDGLKHLW
jgi:hypothetical protein